MRWCRPILVSALLLGAVLPASAGIFSRKKKVDPVQRVPELVQVLKTDRDDRKRADAAEELRQYDPGQYPQIVPALIEALQGDPKPGVRSETAHTLGKLRPISPPAGQALERAAAQDHSLRVRLQARTALMFYHMAGYSAAKKAEPPVASLRAPTTQEPPLAGLGPTTTEPPLAGLQPPPPAPLPMTPPASGPSLYRPLPPSAVVPPATAPPPLNVPGDGPVLAPLP